MAEQEQGRSEPATPFRLSEARKRGSVAKSLELSSLLALVTLLVVVMLWARAMIERQFRLDAALVSQAHQLSFAVPALLGWLRHVAIESLATLVPLLLPVLAVAIVGGLLQNGPIFSTEPLKPDFNRINPAAGAKRFFSLRLLFEAGKTVVKVVLFGVAIYLLWRSLLPALPPLMHATAGGWLLALLDGARSIVFKLVLVAALIAVVDILFTRWSWHDQLKMSRRQVREELKNREGDPRIRVRLRELRREMLKRAKAVRRLPDADVLITNPTHLAVALLYRREEMSAPQVIAKGSGEIAQHMKEVARRHGVPVVESPTLARTLYDAVDLDGSVPERYFAPVAKLLVWVYALRERRTRTAAEAAR
jgi:flagellar biosynthesis protein FlhB